MDEQVDLVVASAEWRLGRLRGSDAHALAIRLLEEGHTSPSLLELAGTPAYALGRDVEATVERAFEEAGVPLPTREEAAMVLARRVAREIVAGQVEPYEGAQRIWTLAYDAGDANYRHLARFVGYASQIEDHPESLAEYEPSIRQEAARLLSEVD